MPETLESFLVSYLPEKSVEYCVSLIQRRNVQVSVVPNRATLLGTYSPPRPNRSNHKITVNRGLNKYHFLVTLIHELAHMENWIEHRRRVAPHGPEWQSHYQSMMRPLVVKDVFPESLARALLEHLEHPPAGSCSDKALAEQMAAFDDDGTVLLKELPKGALFSLKSGRMLLRKGDLMRTRYVCTDARSGAKFRVSPVAKVVQSEQDCTVKKPYRQS